MWFRLLGYSWALQGHLDIVRKQIKNPDEEIISSKFLITAKSMDWKPWIGLVNLLGDTVPAFGLKRHIVVLPPRDRPDYYKSLGKFETDISFSDIKPLNLPEQAAYGPPLAILFENRLIVHAAPSKESEKHAHAVLFIGDSNEGKILRPVEKREFDQLRKQKNAKYINIKVT